MKKLLPVLILASAVSGSLLIGGCGEKPVDPVTANKGEAQQLEIPGRGGRNERAALEAHERNQGR